jgi:hypothetical protein
MKKSSIVINEETFSLKGKNKMGSVKDFSDRDSLNSMRSMRFYVIFRFGGRNVPSKIQF